MATEPGTVDVLVENTIHNNNCITREIKLEAKEKASPSAPGKTSCSIETQTWVNGLRESGEDQDAGETSSDGEEVSGTNLHPTTTPSSYLYTCLSPVITLYIPVHTPVR